MTDLISSPLYRDDIKSVSCLPLPWEKMQDTTVLVAGATGLIGRFLIDVLMYRNCHMGMNCHVIAVGRSSERAHNCFSHLWNTPLFQFLAGDINDCPIKDIPDKMDYLVHLASNTHPVAYAQDPVGTIMTNTVGTRNLLETARLHGNGRFLFCSSNEIYGENRGDVEWFREDYCGYIDSNTLRAGYPEAKRCAEALCQAYIKQYDMDVVIPRLTRTFGPTMLETDTKASSQLIRDAVSGRDICLKSDGRQQYSYLYVADAVSGLLHVMLQGECGAAYNIADRSCEITLREFARVAAEAAGTNIVYAKPGDVESAGFSRVTKAKLDGSKLRQLGWMPAYLVPEGIKRTVCILKETDNRYSESKSR